MQTSERVNISRDEWLDSFLDYLVAYGLITWDRSVYDSGCAWRWIDGTRHDIHSAERLARRYAIKYDMCWWPMSAS